MYIKFLCLTIIIVLFSYGLSSAENSTNFGDLNRGVDILTFKMVLPIFQLEPSGKIVPGTIDLMLPVDATSYRATESAWTNFTFAAFNINVMYLNYQSQYTGESFSGSKDRHTTIWVSEYMEQDYSYSDATKTFTVATVEINPYISTLDPGFEKTIAYIEANMDTYDYNTIYTFIINEYGTHVYQIANVGGQLRYSVYMSNCIIRDRSETWFSSQVTTDFGLHTDTNSAYSLDSLYKNTQFKASAAYASGGTMLIDTLNPTNTLLWLNSIPENPVTTGGTLIRLSKVISLKYPKTAQFLDQAINDYIMNSKINDIAHTKLVYPSHQDIGFRTEDGLCPPCISTCKGQQSCPGEGTCKYYQGCNYGWARDMEACQDMAGDKDTQKTAILCSNRYISMGDCAHVMPSRPSHLCMCYGYEVAASTVTCTTDCVPL